MRLKKLKDSIGALNSAMTAGEGDQKNSANQFFKMIDSEYTKAENENKKIYFEQIPDK